MTLHGFDDRRQVARRKRIGWDERRSPAIALRPFRGRQVRRQVFWLNGAAGRAHRHRALNLVPQLTDVAGPPVPGEQVQRLGTEMDVGLAQTLARVAQEERAQVRDLLATLPQRRDMDADHAEPVVEIFAELTLGHPLLEVGVGRGEHADVHCLWTRFADRHDLALLQEAKQLRLDVERQVADFVEEQRASDGGANQPLLIGDRAGEAAAAMPEQLAVGQLASRRRAVVGEEHRGASGRADMNRARDEVFAGAAFPGDQHGEVVTLQPLDLVGEAIHRRAGADESGQQRLEWSLVVLIDRLTRTFARAAQIESLPRDCCEHAQAASDRVFERRVQRERAASRPVLIGAECFDNQQPAVVLRVTLSMPAWARLVATLVSHPAAATTRTSPPPVSVNTTTDPPSVTSRRAAAVSRASSSGKIAASTSRLTMPSSASETEAVKVFAGAARQAFPNGLDLGEIALRAEQRELRCRLLQISFCDGWRSRCGRQSSEREVAQRRLIPLAEQLEDVRALREVVMGCLRAGRLLADETANARNSPQLAGALRGSRRPSHASSRCSASRRRPVANQRFTGGEVGLNRVARRDARRLRERVGHRDRFVECLSPRGQLDAEYFQRPLVPAHGLRAVRTVRFAGEPQILVGAFVRAAHQMNLRERVEHRARRLVELDGAPDFERASEDLLGAFEVAELNEDLAERRECDGEAVTRSERLMQRDAALGERERLIVAMLHQRHVRLVVHDPREHVVGGNRHGETLALAQCGDRFVAAAGLREQNGRQRVHEREVATIASGMQRGSGLGQMLANDAGIADLLVAERKLVVREADGARSRARARRV